MRAATEEPTDGDPSAAGTDHDGAGVAGPPIELWAPPLDVAPDAACSFRHPLCVHAPNFVPPSRRLAALAAAERAWEAATESLALPAPATRLDGTFDLYLARAVAGGGAARLWDRDPRGHFDRGLAFALLDDALRPGCALDLGAARAIVEAALLEAVPADAPASARAQAEELTRLAVPCADPRPDTRVFQDEPERPMVDPTSADFDRGAALFYEWLDTLFARSPGGLTRGLLALAPTRTAPNAARWSGSPTTFDVLRISLHGAFGPDSGLDDLFARFAVSRADATPGPRLAWHIGWPAKARRLASPEPVGPSGASYVLVDRAGAGADARLRLEAEWEDYGKLRWFAIKLGADGRPTSAVPVTSLERGTRASMTVEELEGTSGVLIVAANVGSTEHPFDPDQSEWEPHGWLLTLESQ